MNLIKSEQEELNKLKQFKEEKEKLLEGYRIFPDFLEKVISDKTNESFLDITDLQNRFKSLKSENNTLVRNVSNCLFSGKCFEFSKISFVTLFSMVQKANLQREMEETRQKEKLRMNQL